MHKVFIIIFFPLRMQVFHDGRQKNVRKDKNWKHLYLLMPWGSGTRSRSFELKPEHKNQVKNSILTYIEWNPCYPIRFFFTFVLRLEQKLVRRKSIVTDRKTFFLNEKNNMLYTFDCFAWSISCKSHLTSKTVLTFICSLACLNFQRIIAHVYVF